MKTRWRCVGLEGGEHSVTVTLSPVVTDDKTASLMPPGSRLTIHQLFAPRSRMYEFGGEYEMTLEPVKKEAEK